MSGLHAVKMMCDKSDTFAVQFCKLYFSNDILEQKETLIVQYNKYRKMVSTNLTRVYMAMTMTMK